MDAPAIVAARTLVTTAALCASLAGATAFAQPHHTAVHHADAGAPHVASESPGHFQAAATLPTQAVNTGAAANTETAPSSDELRGAAGPAPDVITGPIGPSDAARIVQSQMARLRPCYENARAAHARLAGRVELRFTIDRAGHVAQSAAVGMPEAPEVASCLAAALRQTTFPRPSEPPLQIFYPVTFAPPPSMTGHGHPAPHAGAPAAHH